MLKRKKSFIILIIITSLILASCTGKSEINDIGVITATGIDYVDGKILLTNEVINPTSSINQSDSQSEPVLYLQHEGYTVFDAVRNATLTFDRKLNFSHNNVLIFGEEFAKRGIGDYINFYLYDNEPRESTYFLVAKGSKAYEVMGINEGLTDTPAGYIQGLIENYEFTSKTRSISLSEYIKYYFQSKSAVLGIIEKEEKRVVNKEIPEGKGNKRDVLSVEGGAAFYKDSLIGYYTGEEMMGFNFIVDEIQGGLIVFEVPDKNISPDTKYTATKGKYTVVEIKKNKTKKDIKIEDGKINLTIDVKLTGVIGEETKGVDLREIGILHAVEEACSNKVEEHMKKTMDKAQKELKVDTFGIYSLFHRKYPEEWEKISNDWESIFPNISYDINVETNIVRTGLIDVPINIKKGDNNAY